MRERRGVPLRIGLATFGLLVLALGCYLLAALFIGRGENPSRPLSAPGLPAP